MQAPAFVKCLREYKSPNVFNPYAGRCKKYDHNNSAEIRQKNLTYVLLKVIELPLDSIWIGRDLGHRGGRRTGLAFTDEDCLEQAGEYWEVSLKKSTKGEVFKEITASNIWRILAQMHLLIMTWNVFPFHPHKPNNPFSNRSHIAKERKDGEEILAELIEITRPKRLVAIGKEAYRSARTVSTGIPVHGVRHPSYGGQSQFLSGISDLYNLSVKGLLSTDQ